MNTDTSKTTASGDRAGARSGSGAGGIGDKIKGAFHVVHGVGENIRGTALGAVETMAHKGETENDEIARRGRLEAEQGMAAFRGQKFDAPVQRTTQHDSTGQTVNTSGLGPQQGSGDVSIPAAGAAGGPGASSAGNNSRPQQSQTMPGPNMPHRGPAYGNDTQTIGNRVGTGAGIGGGDSNRNAHEGAVPSGGGTVAAENGYGSRQPGINQRNAPITGQVGDYEGARSFKGGVGQGNETGNRTGPGAAGSIRDPSQERQMGTGTGGSDRHLREGVATGAATATAADYDQTNPVQNLQKSTTSIRGGEKDGYHVPGGWGGEDDSVPGGIGASPGMGGYTGGKAQEGSSLAASGFDTTGEPDHNLRGNETNVGPGQQDVSEAPSTGAQSFRGPSTGSSSQHVSTLTEAPSSGRVDGSKYNNGIGQHTNSGGDEGQRGATPYHHRDDAVTDLNARSGDHDHGTGRPSTTSGHRAPLYDHNERFGTQNASGGVHA